MSGGVFISGTNLIQRTLPCFPGYAMGGIIRTGDLELPYLEQQVMDLYTEIQNTENQKRSLKENSNEVKDPQREDVVFTSRIEKLTLTITTINKKIEGFLMDKEGSPFSETMLPIDYNRSILDYKHRSDESENMHFIIVKKQTAKTQIEDFTQHLTKMRYLPAVVGLIEQISGSVLNQAKQEDQEVCLLGSFITLSRVRVIDPIVIRENAKLSKDLTNKETAAKYSVISESVLGGVFIGFGVRISKHQEVEQDIKSITSRLHAFSFVSQGAIPPTENFNLWDTYNSWKKKLISDDHCGFPIAFKVRNLTDVLQENGYFN